MVGRMDGWMDGQVDGRIQLWMDNSGFSGNNSLKNVYLEYV